MGYVKEQWELGDNPDPSKWHDVKTPAGWYRKRRRAKGSKLNPVLTKNAKLQKAALSAADRIIGRLEPWIRGLELNSVRMTMCGKLKKRMNETGKADYAYMNDIDIQPYRPLTALLRAPYSAEIVKNELVIKIQMTGRVIELANSIATDFYFEGILVWGDPTKEKAIRVESTESKLYSIKGKKDETCFLTVDLPTKKVPWMALLKVSCLEGDELAINPRHYGLKVVAVG